MAARRRLVVQSEVRLPGDKSVSHRALILGSLATGASRIRGILRSQDIESTAHVLRTLGADVPRLAEEMSIAGRGLAAFLPPASNLNCGNSGTTARLVMGVTAAQPFASTFTGDVSLSRRPMRRVALPLTAMGAQIEYLGELDGLPLIVNGGTLDSIEWRLETASAQVKSAILLAAICGRVGATICEPAPSRDHTERLLGAQGARLERTGDRLQLTAVDSLGPLDIRVPGDPSAAAFLAALGALADDGEVILRDIGLNPGRLGFFYALARMGASVTVEPRQDVGPEPLGDIFVRPGRLCGISVGAADIPGMVDELPILACLAARADGETVITGAQELRVKESDRIAAVVANLRAIGADAEELPDGMRIVGGRSPLSGIIQTHGDHRLAMAFGVLAALADMAIEVDDPGCVAVSYPAFWEDVARVVG